MVATLRSLLARTTKWSAMLLGGWGLATLGTTANPANAPVTTDGDATEDAPEEADCHRPLSRGVDRENFFMCYLAALADTAVYFVALFAVGIVVIYIRWGLGPKVFAGLAAAALVWLVIGLVRAPFSIPNRARARSYTSFLGRFRAVETRICILRERLALDQDSAPARANALADAEAYREVIYAQLAEIDLRWVRGEGYVSLWESLNSAEEALMIDDFAELAVKEGLQLELRLHNSKVPNADALLVKLRHAMVDLDQATSAYLMQQPPALPAPTGNATPCDGDSRAGALLALRQVTSAMNGYRAERWSGIVRARNAVLDIAVFVGLGLTAVLGLVVLEGVSKTSVAVGALFYLSGVMAGWFHWWWVEERGEKLVDDFGLRGARLLATIVLSGTAALFGVVVVQLWDDIKDFDITVAVQQTETPVTTPSATFETPVPTPAELQTPSPTSQAPAGTPTQAPGVFALALISSATSEATPGATTTAETPPTATATPAMAAAGGGIDRLKHTFDLDSNLVGLFVAAVFGYAPQVLVQILQRPTERYKSDLRSTEATDGG